MASRIASKISTVANGIASAFASATSLASQVGARRGARRSSRWMMLCSALILPALAWPAAARAEGFLCTSLEQITQIEIHLTSINEIVRGHTPLFTREAHKMIIRDLSLQPKRQFIAQFEAEDGLLDSIEGRFAAQVDLENPNSSQRGKRIGGTRLGYLDTISVDIDFSYQQRLPHGIRLGAQVLYLKTNGVELTEDFECVYYSDLSALERASYAERY